MSSAISSAPAPPKAGAAPKPEESTWADPLPRHRPNIKRPPDDAGRARRCRNWRIATTAAYPPCAVPRAARESGPRMPELPTISKDEIADALRRSGYLIEYRIEDVLRRHGYHVSANTTY